MNAPDRDPFEQLAQVKSPEPDPVVMNAVIAQSREAFEQKRARTPSRRVDWWRQPFKWLIPTAASAFALTVAILVVPSLIDTQTVDSEPDRIVADAPTPADVPPAVSRGDDPVVAEAPTPFPPSGGVRMGAQGPQGQQPIDPQSIPMSMFTGEDVRLGFRLTPDALLLYLPDISGDEPIESQGLVPGEEAEILAAFGLPDDNLFAVQLRVDSTRFWRAYSEADGVFSRDADLTALVSDAADQDEAIKRLLAR